MLSSCANWRRVVPAEHFRQSRTRASCLPDGVLVLAKSIQRGDGLFYWQTANWLAQSAGAPGTPEETHRIHECGYKISMQIGALVATIAICPIASVH